MESTNKWRTGEPLEEGAYMEIKYIVYQIIGEYSNETGYFSALRKCESFDTEEQALKALKRYVNSSEHYTVMKVYCKKKQLQP